ncbi:MAG: ATPase [Crocinitomicaceae bacterium]|jgi:predicted AAA+ superfamily ATPase|nr:ATPase [Crocinitomicaceae bacterium]
MKQVKRALEIKLKKWFHKRKAIVLTGARQVGKTTLLLNFFKEGEDVQFMNADEIRVRTVFEDLNLPNLKALVGSSKYVIIDEVQRISNPGLLLKLLVDNFKDTQFIATGSSALEISDKIFEPLTGRHVLFHLYPFSMTELYPRKNSFQAADELPFHLLYGMYPDICNFRDDAEFNIRNLANQYLYKDVLIWKNIRKPELLENLLKMLAYQVGQEISVHELANNLKVKSETVESYLDLLEKSFVIFRLKAYSTNPRKEISKMSKVYFWDLGIRNAVIDDFRPLPLRQDTGQLWENFVISERLKKNAYQEEKRKSFFWRNYNQSEVDYVEHFKDELLAFEIKWNNNKNQRVSPAFLNSYPQAKGEVISQLNFMDFLKD